MSEANATYTLAELLDIGLKMLQFKVEDKLKIKTVPVDPNEKNQRMSRIMRQVAKEDKKREERHSRQDEQRTYRESLTNTDGKIVINLATETTDTSRETLANMALAQQIVAQEAVVQQLVHATAISATVAATAAAMVHSMQPVNNKPNKSVSLQIDRPFSNKKVKLSLADYFNSRDSSPGNFAGGCATHDWQTVMLRNIPNKYTRDQLLERFNMKFKAEFDLLYLPIDFHHKCNIGYVFVNFKRPESVARFIEEFDGRNASECLPEYNSSKVCEVTPAHVQGLELMIEHLRASPIAEQLRSKSRWQPLLFDEQGEPMPFPLNPNKTKIIATNSGKSSVKYSSSSPRTSTTKSVMKKSEYSNLSSPAATSPASKVSEDESEAKERETFPMKEKRRKLKHKRNAEESLNYTLEPCTIDSDIHTTAMVRYIPEELTRSALHERLCTLLPKGSFNFLYMPIDFDKGTNVGYFFINFCGDAISKCVQIFHNVVAREVFTDSVCDDLMEVSAARVQGLEPNISNLQNSSVGAIAGTSFEWKPLLFSDNGSSEELNLIGQGQDPSLSLRRKVKKESVESVVLKNPARKPKALTEKRHTAPPPATGTDYKNFKTVMLRHLPNKYTCLMLQQQLEKLGFATTYDLLYLPIDAKNKCNIGYAFINFRTNEGVQKCFKAFQGVECAKCLPGFNSSKIVEVTPARMQGLEANVRHMKVSVAVEQLLKNPDWAPVVLDSANEPIEYPWDAVGKKLNPSAEPFVPPEIISKMPMPSLDDIVNPQSLEHLLTTRWMLAMECMYRSSMPLRQNENETETVDPAVHTTVMIRNIPNKFTRDKLLQKVKETMPENSIDFFYVPIDLKNKCNMGYCFVNFRTAEAVTKCVATYHNVKSSVCLPSFNSSKVCIVTPARRQGLQNNISHLVNESVVFQTLTKRGLDDWLPMQFDDFGNEVVFSHEGSARLSKKGKFVASYYGEVLNYIDPSEKDYTTIMIQGFSSDFRNHHLVSELEKSGLKGEFDFLYMPPIADLAGYAFINFTSKDAVKRAISCFNKRVLPETDKMLVVTPARVQGLNANVRYVASFQDVDVEKLPMVFDADGEAIPFPSMPQSVLRSEASEFKPQATAIVS